MKMQSLTQNIGLIVYILGVKVDLVDNEVSIIINGQDTKFWRYIYIYSHES